MTRVLIVDDDRYVCEDLATSLEGLRFEKAFKDAQAKLPPDFDQAAYDAKWRDLDRRICAALPMDPASPQAQAFLDEWDALIQPFLEVATPEMLEGVMNLNAHIEEWQGEVESDFSAEAYRFHLEAHKAREEMRGS